MPPDGKAAAHHFAAAAAVSLHRAKPLRCQWRGGIAGLQSALDLADQGYQVALVEKQPSIGGKMIALSKVFPTLDCASCHRAHGTDYEHMFPFATYTFLCVQCHTDMRR